MFIAHVSIKLTLLKTCIAQIKTCIIIKKSHTTDIQVYSQLSILSPIVSYKSKSSSILSQS